ncbi:MAG: SpoIIE family protein phosphatase [Firmicutes bacterium]|nr:SpoIIE family protein phosphatase [Bacillota bacterium]
MPKKSVREMNESERRKYSLSARVFNATVASSLIIGLIALMIGLGLYTKALLDNYITESYTLARSGAAIINRVVDVEKLSSDVMKVYDSLSEEELQEMGSDEYYDRFIDARRTSDARTALAFLKVLTNNSNLADVYLATLDTERNALVMFIDPDERPGHECPTGYWETLPVEMIQTYTEWDGSSELYYVGKTDRYQWQCIGGYPVRGLRGQIVGYVMTSVTLTEISGAMKLFVLKFVIATLLVVLLVAYLMTRHMQKTLVDPINSIAGAAESYVSDKREGLQIQDHFEKLHIRTGDEVENLSFVMADMERDLNEYEKNLKRSVSEQQRVSTELSFAADIQSKMLPIGFQVFPDRNDVELYASMKPAKEVGGDYYDFFLVDDDHLALCIADVSGKGVPASLMMMATKIYAKIYTMTGKDPAQVLEIINEAIYSRNLGEMFVTMWMGILDLRTGVLTASNAGHEYPAIMRNGKSFELFKDRHGFVLGGMSGMKYTNYDIQLSPGDMIFVYTDGVPESTDENEELFGTQRMTAALNEDTSRSPQEQIEDMGYRIEAFVGGAPQFDDITMLCARYNGYLCAEAGPEQEKESRLMKELNIEAIIENVPAVTAFVDGELEAMDCPLKAQMQIDVAIDELFSNIAMYAYDPETGPATVRVEVEEDPMAVIITFIDHGKPYDPLAAADPDVTLAPEDRPMGGLGVFLVKKTMDDVSYEYVNGQNILRIKKKV